MDNEITINGEIYVKKSPEQKDSERKYRFTGECIDFKGRTLRRIQAEKDFSNVKRGELGGWIEKEDNLSHEGNAWVYDEGKVFDDAVVRGDAKAYGNARVYDDAAVRDNVWVYGNAAVFGVARIGGNVRVCGNTRVYDNAWVCNSATGVMRQHNRWLIWR